MLDANVLLLLVVGSAAREFVGRHKRLEAFGAADFDFLLGLVESAAAVTTTPNAWTEVSNIVGFGVAQPLKSGLQRELKTQIARLSERYVPSDSITADYAFVSLGLSDAAFLLALDDDTILLTTDVPLFEEAHARGHRVLNFHELREQLGLV